MCKQAFWLFAGPGAANRSLTCAGVTDLPSTQVTNVMHVADQTHFPRYGQSIQMVVCDLMPVPADKKLKAVEPQPYYRGTLVIAEDRRQEYLIISASVHVPSGLNDLFAALSPKKSISSRFASTIGGRRRAHSGQVLRSRSIHISPLPNHQPWRTHSGLAE